MDGFTIIVVIIVLWKAEPIVHVETKFFYVSSIVVVTFSVAQTRWLTGHWWVTKQRWNRVKIFDP